jgi:hypothetical protein
MTSPGRAPRAHPILGVVALLSAAIALWIGLRVTPSRSSLFTLAFVAVEGLGGAGGLALVAAAVARRGLDGARRLAIVAASAQLALAAAIVVLLGLSAAYLRGIYGALGEGLAWAAVVAAALVVEALAIVPTVQLVVLLGRRR